MVVWVTTSEFRLFYRGYLELGFRLSKKPAVELQEKHKTQQVT